MPSTFDPLLRLELQATGENRTTWGIKANNDFTLAAQAIAGHVSVNIGGLSSYSLVVAEASTDEARMGSITLSGVLTGNVNVFVPAVSKNWIFRDNTTGNYQITIKTSTGDGLALAEGTTFVWCDGVSVRAASETNRVSRAGDVMTGPLSLPAGTSVSASQAMRRDEIISMVATMIDAAVSVAMVDKIVIWRRSIVSIPTGWALCDGTNGTPDLRGVFVRGASATVSVDSTGGGTTYTTDSAGGHDHGGFTGSVSLSVGQMPSHTHAATVVDPGHNHHMFDEAGYKISMPGTTNTRFVDIGINANLVPGGINSDPNYTGISVGVSVAGGGETHQHVISSVSGHTHGLVSVLPPYYTLCYIMKLA